jgi:hypothetical protein
MNALLPATGQTADPIIALWAQRNHLRDVWSAGPTDNDPDPAFDAWMACEDQISNTPATSIEGLAIKARLLVKDIEDMYGDTRLGKSLANDLQRFAEGLS